MNIINEKSIPLKNIEIDSKDFTKFRKYLNDFYGKRGVYPNRYGKDLQPRDVLKAIDTVAGKNPKHQWDWDSLDRELVRDELIKMRKFDYPTQESAIKEISEVGKMFEDETQDPQEIKVGEYQTKFFDMCPGASQLYKDIESKGVDLELAERSVKLQDALFAIEKHILQDWDWDKVEKGDEESSKEKYWAITQNIVDQIRKMAEMMDLVDEHSYIQGHLETIEKALYGDEEVEPTKDTLEGLNEADVVGKTIFSDGKGKLFFGYYKTDDAVEFVDYKTWKKLRFKDVSKGDTNKDRVIKAIVKNQKQFNKKVDFNMWAKKQKRSFEDTMDWFIKNRWISNITKRGIKESVDVLSVNENNISNLMKIMQNKYDRQGYSLKQLHDEVINYLGKKDGGLVFQQFIKKNKSNKKVQDEFNKTSFSESVNEGKKRYYQQDRVGSSKYTISYHDGKKKHKDGSDFFDIKTFKNQRDLAKFVNGLHRFGFVYGHANESINERSINSISKDREKNATRIKDTLELYKKAKDGNDAYKKKSIIKLLYKLNDEKKKLEKELDDKISGLYKDAEFKEAKLNHYRITGNSIEFYVKDKGKNLVLRFKDKRDFDKLKLDLNNPKDLQKLLDKRPNKMSISMGESINEYLSPSDVDSLMKEKGIRKIPISSQGERLLKGMVKEKFLKKVTNLERLVYFYQSLGRERFGYGVKGKPLSPLVSRFSNDLMDESITFGGKMAAYQVAMNIKDRLANEEEVDSTYYMLKDYFNSFGMDTNRSRVFKSANFHMDEWLKRNKKIAKQIDELNISKDDMEKLHKDGEVEIDGEKVTFQNEGKFKPSQVRSAISKVKKQLMRKWKQKGGYENFGQKELRQLQNKFDYNAYGDKDEREISHMLDAFDNWAMNYDGSMREDANEIPGRIPSQIKVKLEKALDILKEEFKHSNHVDITDKLYDILYNQADDFIGKGIDYSQRNKKFEDAISKYIIYSKTDKEKQQAKKQINTELDSMIKSYKKDVADKVNKLFKSIDKEVSNIKKHTK